MNNSDSAQMSHFCIWYCSVRFNDGFRHAERGDYEMRNGKRIFIIRGIFHYFSLTVFVEKLRVHLYSVAEIFYCVWNFRIFSK